MLLALSEEFTLRLGKYFHIKYHLSYLASCRQISKPLVDTAFQPFLKIVADNSGTAQYFHFT